MFTGRIYIVIHIAFAADTGVGCVTLFGAGGQSHLCMRQDCFCHQHIAGKTTDGSGERLDNILVVNGPYFHRKTVFFRTQKTCFRQFRVGQIQENLVRCCTQSLCGTDHRRGCIVVSQVAQACSGVSCLDIAQVCSIKRNPGAVVLQSEAFCQTDKGSNLCLCISAGFQLDIGMQIQFHTQF